MNEWVRILPGDKNYDDYVIDAPRWKVIITQIFDTAFRIFLVACILSMAGIILTGHWVTGLVFFLSGLIFAFSLWFRQLFYFHIIDKYKTMSSWHYERRKV